jgi:hypothetical protein
MKGGGGNLSMRRQYDAFGVCLEVDADRQEQLARLSRWLTVPPLTKRRSPDARLVWHEAAVSEFDRLLPLPDESALQSRQMVDMGYREVRHSSYRTEAGIWTEYEGLSRVFLAAHEPVAITVWAPGLYPYPDFGDLLAAVGPLNRLLRHTGIFMVHGSCVEIDGQAILFVGQSFRGKSTAAYALMRQGYPVLNDDRVLVWQAKDGYRVGTLSDVFKLRDASLNRFFPELIGHETMGCLEGEKLFKISEIPSLRFCNQAKLAGLLMLDKTGQPDSRLVEVHPARLVEELLPGSLSAFDVVWSPKVFGFLMELLMQVPCAKLEFGTDMTKFVAAVDKWQGMQG